jgi:putative FmdB family regulatory protein
MPLYEYQCQSCSVVIEALQRMADAPLTVCEQCGGPLKRLISAPAVQFKGTGWYVTDYARKGAGAAGRSESKGEGKSESSSGESKGEGKGEGKSEAKAESGGGEPAAKPSKPEPAAS